MLDVGKTKNKNMVVLNLQTTETLKKRITNTCHQNRNIEIVIKP